MNKQEAKEWVAQNAIMQDGKGMYILPFNKLIKKVEPLEGGAREVTRTEIGAKISWFFSGVNGNCHDYFPETIEIFDRDFS